VQINTNNTRSVDQNCEIWSGGRLDRILGRTIRRATRFGSGPIGARFESGPRKFLARIEKRGEQVGREASDVVGREAALGSRAGWRLLSGGGEHAGCGQWLAQGLAAASGEACTRGCSSTACGQRMVEASDSAWSLWRLGRSVARA
jgi:hypothetical protein